MVFLKEDGSLDIDRMDALPMEENMKMIRRMTDEQYHQYVASFPENEGTQHTEPIVVDYSMADEIRKGTGVDIDEYLAKKEKRIRSKIKEYNLGMKAAALIQFVFVLCIMMLMWTYLT